MPPVTYATVHEVRKSNRVAASTRVGFGTWVALALEASAVNTGFVERHNGTDRKRQVRKLCVLVRRGDVPGRHGGQRQHCWPVQTLRQKDADGRRQRRTPALPAELTDRAWSLAEWLAFPDVQRR